MSATLRQTPPPPADSEHESGPISEPKAIAEGEPRYRSLVENIPDVVWSATREGKLLFISETVRSVLGFSAAQFLAGEPGEGTSRLHPDDEPRFRAAFTALLEHGIALDTEYRWRHRDERWIWLHCRARAGIGADGEACVTGVFSDVTEWKRLEAEKAQSIEAAAVVDLAERVAHFFNNVLATIVANGDYISTRLPSVDTDLADAIRDIRTSAEQGIALTRHLRTCGPPGATPTRAEVDDFVARVPAQFPTAR
jgi:PAS domain S-box-containing protein